MNKGLKRSAVRLSAIAALIAVSGCANGVSSSSEVEQGPVGIGRSINELKGTPCACTEIPMSLPTHLRA